MAVNLYFIVPLGLKNDIVASQIVPLYRYSKYQTDKKYLLTPSHVKDCAKNVINYRILFFALLKNKLHGIFYCRSIFDFLAVYFYKITFRSRDIRVIYDFRGLISEESFIRNGNYFRKYILQILERFAYIKSDEIHCVANKFKHYLIAKYGFRNIVVIPCCSLNYDGKKTQKPKDETKFVYVGSMARWQNFSGVVDFYKQLENLYQSTSLKVITRETEIAHAILKNSNIRSYELLTLPYNEIIENISDCHFGFILRDNTIVNYVSSPIKFLEYLQAGVLPVISTGVGDYSELVANEGIGLVVSNVKNPELDFEKFDYEKISIKVQNIALQYTWTEFFKNNKFTML